MCCCSNKQTNNLSCATLAPPLGGDGLLQLSLASDLHARVHVHERHVLGARLSAVRQGEGGVPGLQLCGGD